jgi:hypothetical protein
MGFYDNVSDLGRGVLRVQALMMLASAVLALALAAWSAVRGDSDADKGYVGNDGTAFVRPGPLPLVGAAALLGLGAWLDAGLAAGAGGASKALAAGVGLGALAWLVR